MTDQMAQGRHMKNQRQPPLEASPIAGSGSTLEPYSEAWWKMLEDGRVEKAKNFGPTADVVSAMAARAMVVEAVGRLRGKT